MITLKVQDLSKSFGSTEVLKKINLEIEEGNFLVLLCYQNFLKDLVLLMLSSYPFTAPEVSPLIKYLPANT